MTGYFGFVLPKNCSVYNLLIEFQKITIITCDPLRIRERRKSQRPLPLRERAAFVALELAELIEAMLKAILVRDGRGRSCPAFLWGRHERHLLHDADPCRPHPLQRDFTFCDDRRLSTVRRSRTLGAD